MNVGVRVSTVLPFAGVSRLNPPGASKSMKTVQVSVDGWIFPTLSTALTDHVWAPSERAVAGVEQVDETLVRTAAPSIHSS